MLRQLRPVLIVILSLALSACPVPRRPSPPPQEQPVLKPVPGAQLFQVLPEQSLVRILVYRGGTLATVGRNHVIASHDVTGKVYLHKDLQKSAFELDIPVDKLTIDEADLRHEEGGEFSPQVPESARQSTRKNMLSEALLDGEHYPAIRIISTGVKGMQDSLAVAVRIGIKDRWSFLIAPIAFQNEGGRLTATGELELRQSDLGLKPFSVMMGALQVRDDFKVKFHIVAGAAQTSSSP